MRYSTSSLPTRTSVPAYWQRDGNPRSRSALLTRFLGTDVNLGKNGVITEVQFSDYPFLLNNLMRSELLFKAGVDLPNKAAGLLIVMTKAHMFPASTPRHARGRRVGP